MQVHRIGSFLLLLLGAASVFADQGNYRRDAREAVRAYQVQSVTMERSMPRDQTQGVQPQDRRRQNHDAPESSGYSSSGDGQSNSQQAENARRQGRMSPEERRALRRQIDEAGHDIYSPKR
jgi:hypothetical protein